MDYKNQSLNRISERELAEQFKKEKLTDFFLKKFPNQADLFAVIGNIAGIPNMPQMLPFLKDLAANPTILEHFGYDNVQASSIPVFELPSTMDHANGRLPATEIFDTPIVEQTSYNPDEVITEPSPENNQKHNQHPLFSTPDQSMFQGAMYFTSQTSDSAQNQPGIKNTSYSLPQNPEHKTSSSSTSGSSQPSKRIDISNNFFGRSRGPGRPRKDMGSRKISGREFDEWMEDKMEPEIPTNEKKEKQYPKSPDEWISHHIQQDLSSMERPHKRVHWKNSSSGPNLQMQLDFEATKRHIEPDKNPGNFLSAAHHLLNEAQTLFREVYIYNTKISIPTFYRHMRPSYSTIDGRRVKVIENLSNIQKDLVKQTFEQLMVYMDNEFRKLCAKAQ